MIRRMFWVSWLCLALTAGMPLPAGAVADVPENVTLTANLDSITVEWQGDSDADGYFVYWGTEPDNLDNRAEVPETMDESFVIENLVSGTVYYVAVSAFDNDVESDRSAVQSVRTLSDTTAPAAPSGLAVTDPAGISSNAVELKWDASPEPDLELYRIYYGDEPDRLENSVEAPAGEAPVFTVTGLSGSRRYYFTVTAVDDSGNESEKPEALIVDTLPDNLAPLAPSGVTVAISGIQEVTVQVVPANENMADFAGNRIYYGREAGVYEAFIDIGKSGKHPVSGLPQNTTWYFAASAYDHSGNESPLTGPVSAVIEETQGFLDDADDFEGGCFISSLFGKKTSPPGGTENRAGVSVGYFKAAESDFEDFYQDDTFPVFLFYDRSVAGPVSIDVRAGYMEETGKLLTVSGEPTGLKTRFRAVPVSASLNYNFSIYPNVWGFAGIGPDYWYCSEDPQSAGAGEDVSQWVGGYHARSGLWLYNEDPAFSQWGMLLECGYYRIDRFGGNRVNPGGWIFSLGLFYGF